MPRPRRNRRPVIGRILVALLAALVLALLIKLLTVSPIFSIKTVTILGDSGSQISPQIRSLTQGQNIILLDEERIRRQIQQNLRVKSITFDKSLPSSLTVRLTFRDPAFAWQAGSVTFLVDDQGLVFQSGSGAGLIKVSGTTPVKIGDRLNPDTVNRVLTLAKLNPTLTTITVGTDYQASLPEGITAIFDPTLDLTQQSQALQLILEKAKIEGKLPRTVNLRFPKPVVTY